jgi:hypothetical protein
VRPLLVAAALLAAAGCNEGLGNAHHDAALRDGGEDLEPRDDLATRAGPTCGQIVMCVFQNFQSPGMLVGCGQGASPQELTAAGALLLCAYQNCLAGNDGGIGGGNMGQTLQCVLKSCATQLGMCDGLFGGPGPM